MDMENDQYGAVTDARAAGDILANNQRAAAAARAAGVLVIYVVARFRPGHPEGRTHATSSRCTTSRWDAW